VNTTLLGAFVAGVLTLLSPCSVMLLPAFFSYAFTSPARLLARTGVFYLGLATTLVPIGVLAGSFGAYVNEHRSALVAAASWVVIGLGALMLAGVRVPMPASADGGRDDATSAASVYALGTVYGLAGVCAGPLLGAVLAMAAVGSSAAYGGVVLLVFAAGMVLPLVVLSLAWDRLPPVRRLVRPRGVQVGRWSNTWTGIVGGALTIGVGVLLLWTDGTEAIGGVLSTEDQFQLERWASERTGGVPDTVFVAAAAAALGSVWAVRRRLRRRRPGERDHDGRRWSPATDPTPPATGADR